MARPLPAALLLLLLAAPEHARVGADLPRQSDRVVEYAIRARLDPAARKIAGEIDLRWRNASPAPVSELYFHLYLNAFRDKESTFLRESGPAAGRGDARFDPHFPGGCVVKSMRNAAGTELWKERFVAPDDQNEDDRTLARVDLPAPVGPGETLPLSISFESTMPRLFRRAGFSGDPERPESLFFMCAQWFPKIAVLRAQEDGTARWNAHQYHAHTEYFSDYGVYRVELDVPRDFAVGASGRRIETREEGDRRIHVHLAEDVHDFAWCAAATFREEGYTWSFDRFCAEAPAPMGERLRSMLEEAARARRRGADEVKPSKEVSVRFLFPADQQPHWRRFLWSVGAALACYGTWYGEYPYDTLTVVVPPDGGRAAGGMEYPTLITVFGNRMDPPYAVGMEAVTIHEFGHQFFYGLLGSNEFEEAWLDEGMNSFSDARAYEAAYGPEIATTRYGLHVTPHLRPFAAPKVFPALASLLRLESWTRRIPRPWKTPEQLLPEPAADPYEQYLREMPFLHFERDVPVPAPQGERAAYYAARTFDSMLLPGFEYAGRNDYRVNSYGKPTMLLYALRGMMGAEAFDRAFHDYAEKHRFRHPTTADAEESLRSHLDPASGSPIASFARTMATSATPVDFSILEAGQREIAEGSGEWLWTVRVQRRGDVRLPVEVWAEDEAGARLLLGTMAGRDEETTKSFRLRSRTQLRCARLGPGWLATVDRTVHDNARLRSGLEEGRTALALAARWTAYVEEIVRSSAGLAR